MDTQLGCVCVPTLDDVGKRGICVFHREEARDLDPSLPIRVATLERDVRGGSLGRREGLVEGQMEQQVLVPSAGSHGWLHPAQDWHWGQK
jgi:hypothetical protein